VPLLFAHEILDPVLEPLNDYLGQQVAYGQLTVEEAAEDLQALIERLVAK
jgi:hypothetical protein